MRASWIALIAAMLSEIVATWLVIDYGPYSSNPDAAVTACSDTLLVAGIVLMVLGIYIRITIEDKR